MLINESLDLGYQGAVVFHAQSNRRDSTRTSTANLHYDAGKMPILSDRAESRTIYPMKHAFNFDVAKLRRAVIEHTSEGKQWSRRGLSLAASGGKNPDLVRDFISRGQDRKPSFDAVAGLAAAMDMDVNEFILTPTPRGGPVYIKVVGAVEAGAWREQSQWPDDQQYEVRALQSDFPELDRFGLVVMGYSMDKLFAPGVVLDCLKLPFSGESPITPTPGQIVIAQHNRGGLCEMTCKRLGRETDGQWYLMPESTKAEHQEKIPIGAPDENYALDDGIVIVGIVSAAIQQFLN
ncbi:MAG: S24 family peptidase [Pseudomonadota bacterium]